LSAFADSLNRWNRRFAEPGYLFGEEPNRWLQAARPHLREGRSLVVADGEGRNGVWLASLGHQVEGFDFSEVAVAKARQLAQRRGVRVHWDACAWDAFEWKPARYNNVVGIFFQFAAPQDRQTIFARMDRALKPGGLLVIQGYTAAQLRHNTGGPGILEHMYDEDLMRNSFSGYHFLALETYEAVIEEGSGHRGMSGLLGMLAQKPGPLVEASSANTLQSRG
jgi:SAM-dependent methyltransferase